MKSKFTAVILVLLLLIPSAIGAASYIITKNAPLSEEFIDTIGISDLNGKSYVLKKGDTADGASEMFSAILKANSESTVVAGGLPEPLIGKKFFAVSFHGLEQTLNYQYYFMSYTTDAYFVDNEAVAHKLPESFVSEFQNSRYALSLYDGAEAPTLTVAGKYSVTPDTLSWRYKLADGTFAANDTIPDNTPPTDNYFIDGGIDFSFTYEPDLVNVKVYDGKNELIFDDDYAELASLSFDSESAIAVELSASWLQSESCEYYGEATYKFSADVPAPADFAINKTQIDPGDFVIVSISNVYDTSRISFACDPVIGFEPTFYLEDTTARALIPISYELAAGTYKLTMSYGAETANIDLSVAEKTFKTAVSLIPESVEAQKRTSETLAQFESALKAAASSGSETIYFNNGRFFDCTVDAKGFAIIAGVGVNKKISATGTTYRHNGVDLRVDVGEDVNAVMDGEVIYVGETTLSGKLVVIEHGLGLKSWYAHLGSYDVAVGDKVEKGQVIAKTGDTGFTDGTTLHLGLSVFDVPVSIYPLWENNGLEIKDPEPASAATDTDADSGAAQQ